MKPKIFIFCDSCQPNWHSAHALSEDGCFIAGHLCSSHGFIAHDMGINPNGWKRDVYERHYPEGFEVVWVDDLNNPPPEFTAAYARHEEYSEESYRERMAIHKKEGEI